MNNLPTTTGLTQVVWILNHIREAMRNPVPATVDWPEFELNGHGLFLWEAFVSGNAKGETHLRDAELGARAFQASLPDPQQATAIQSDAVHSLIGAAMLRTGWSERIELLSVPCVVIRA